MLIRRRDVRLRERKIGPYKYLTIDRGKKRRKTEQSTQKNRAHKTQPKKKYKFKSRKSIQEQRQKQSKPQKKKQSINKKKSNT
jgi:hypothetical protein